jgi:hypothetical protein
VSHKQVSKPDGESIRFYYLRRMPNFVVGWIDARDSEFYVFDWRYNIANCEPFTRAVIHPVDRKETNPRYLFLLRRCSRCLNSKSGTSSHFFTLSCGLARKSRTLAFDCKLSQPVVTVHHQNSVSGWLCTHGIVQFTSAEGCICRTSEYCRWHGTVTGSAVSCAGPSTSGVLLVCLPTRRTK